jgi:hypothetical protein
MFYSETDTWLGPAAFLHMPNRPHVWVLAIMEYRACGRKWENTPKPADIIHIDGRPRQHYLLEKLCTEVYMNGKRVHEPLALRARLKIYSGHPPGALRSMQMMTFLNGVGQNVTRD